MGCLGGRLLTPFLVAPRAAGRRTGLTRAALGRFQGWCRAPEARKILAPGASPGKGVFLSDKPR